MPLLALAALLALFATSACAGAPAIRDPQPAPIAGLGFAVDTIVVAPPPSEVYAGGTILLSAALWMRQQVTPAPDAKIHWTSDRVDRAWVAEGGVLVLLGTGKVSLTARYATLHTVVTIDVKDNPAAAIALGSDAPVLVYPGDTVRFSAAVHAADKESVADAPVSFAVSARGMPHAASAAIDTGGRFVATRPGLYTIVAASGAVAETATLLVSALDATYGAPVAADAVRKIEVEGVDYEPLVGTAFPLQARVWERGAKAPRLDAPVVWSSSDPALALVDASGVVAFRKPGRVTITAQAGTERATRKFAVRRYAAAHMALTINGADIRAGDAVQMREEVWQKGGMPVRGARVNYAVVAHGPGASAASATVSDDRIFTAREPGIYTIIAELGGVAQQTTVVVRGRGASVER
ncbi:MAG: Ig-like domain-containing protein [Gemmatimonadota bacterium]|nr:Ig-like domain-containing protein [Gemmatimonadota bacterium]